MGSMRLVRLREWRERRGLSQQDLAEISEVARDAISKYEGGKRTAHPSTARRLAESLGVGVEDLVYGDRSEVPLPRFGKEYGAVLEAAKEAGGFEEQIALLKRYAEETEGIPRAVHDWQRRDAELTRAVMELDVKKMPAGMAGVVVSFAQMAAALLGAGVAVPASLTRSAIEALYRESRKGSDAEADDDGRKR